MMPRSLFLLLAAALAQVRALVVCPANLVAGQTYYCFFSVTGTTEAPDQLELRAKSGVGSPVAVATPDDGNPGLYALPVPAGLSGSHVVEAGSAKADVNIAGEASVLLVESDRALYKPGSTARFRVLALSSTLLPQAAKSVTFEVSSPEGFKLMAVEETTDSAGVAHFEFPISEEPLLGPHLARASMTDSTGQGSTATAETTITVEEYVLPRFEVSLELDQSHLTSEGRSWSTGWGWEDSKEVSGKSTSDTETISGAVSALFTFGEPVAGIASIVVWAPISSWDSWEVSSSSDKQSGATSADHKAIASKQAIELSTEDGSEPASFSLEVPKDQLQYGTDLVIEATVVYPATSERQSTTARIPIRYKGSELEAVVTLIDGTNVFRPGLPLEVKVELLKPDGQVPSAEDFKEAGQVSLVIEGNVVDYNHWEEATKQKLTASDFVDGALTLTLSTGEDSSCCNPDGARSTWEEYTKSCGCCKSTMTLYVEKMADGDNWGTRLPAPAGKENYVCASRAYALQGEYLSISPPDSSSSSVFRSTLDPSGFSSNIEYMVVQAGAIVESKTAPLPSMTKSSSGSYYEGNLQLQLPVSLSGSIRLLVIARPQSGPALATSTEFSRDLALPYTLSAEFSAEEVKPGEELSIDFQAGSTISGSVPSTVHTFVASLDKSAELLGQRAAIGKSSLLAVLDRAAGDASPTAVAAKPWKYCGHLGGETMVHAELPGGVQVVSDIDLTSLTESSDDDLQYGEPLEGGCPRPLVDQWSCGGGGWGGWGGGGADDAMMMAEAEMAPVAMAAGMDMAADMGGMEKRSAESNEEEGGGSSSSTNSATGSVRVRKFFPETWLWTDLPLPEGGATLSVTAPDTITTWSLEAFCTSPDGLSAVRSETPLRVFKPFFVEVKLPYSAVRGEDLEVIFTVFNYKEGSGSLSASLALTMPVQVSLVDGEASVELTVPEGEAARHAVRVRPQDLGTWRLKATATATGGLSDAIERALLVKPEGIPMTQTKTVVVDLAGDTPGAVSNALALELPSDAVNGSASLTVTAVGDLLGPTISGLDRLLRIPTGCGEQNMITLAPNVYVAKYLIAVGKLRTDIRQKIVKNMVVGYGRELTYRHSDGSFSAFGTSDDSGSTWLTAFVLRTFAEVAATGLVAVDSSVLEEAGRWLVGLQNTDGSFRSVGQVLHQEMMGGVAGSATLPLTAYITACLAKAKAEVPGLAISGLDSALTKAGQYLSAASDIRTHTGLLRAHALALAGLWSDEQVALAALELSSTTSKGNRYWKDTANTKKQGEDEENFGARGYGSGMSSKEIEMTGYGTLALTHANQLAEAFEAARWLLERRSSLGGYSSTQDTVIALSALAEYAAAVAANVDMTLQVTAPNYEQTMQIDANNVDVLQSLSLPTAGGAIDMLVEASGMGVALVSADLKYNMPQTAVDPCYTLEVKWYGDETTISGGVRACSVPLMNCSSKAAMSMISVGLFTGYSASSTSLQGLKEAKLVKRYEIADGRVDLYVDEPSEEKTTCVQFNVTKEFKVWNLQPAMSQTYDYYAPQQRGESLAAFSMEALPKELADEPGFAPLVLESETIGGDGGRGSSDAAGTTSCSKQVAIFWAASIFLIASPASNY